jgi:hypothetical protein
LAWHLFEKINWSAAIEELGFVGFFDRSESLVVCSAGEFASKLRCVGVLKVIHQIGGALYPGVGQLAYLLAVEAVPPAAVELVVELEDELGVDEVDEGVAHVAGVEVVDGEIQEVNLEFEVAVDLLQQHFLRVLVRDVPDHQGCSPVLLDLHTHTFTLFAIILYYWLSSPVMLRRFRCVGGFS